MIDISTPDRPNAMMSGGEKEGGDGEDKVMGLIALPCHHHHHHHHHRGVACLRPFLPTLVGDETAAVEGEGRREKKSGGVWFRRRRR